MNINLSEYEAKEVLRKAGIPVIETRLARSKSQAVAISRDLGFPVVLKIASPDVVHKSDAGGVKLNLTSGAQVGKAYSEIMVAVKQKFPQAQIEGISVQEMAGPGTEVIIGMSTDGQFGPVLMFGLGGILVEIIKDVSFRVVPLTRRDAREMVRETKGYRLLQGYRGQPPADIHALEDLILAVSRFVDKNRQVNELDLNPVFVYREGVKVADARIVVLR